MGRGAGVGEAVLQQGLGVDGAQGVGRGDTGACDAGAVDADVRDLIVLVGREGEFAAAGASCGRWSLLAGRQIGLNDSHFCDVT